MSTITVEFMGGPRDGDLIALEDVYQPFTVALPLKLNTWEADPMESITLNTINIYPELTRNGWILRWPKGAS